MPPAEAGGLEFERLWPPLKKSNQITVKSNQSKKLPRQIVLPYSYHTKNKGDRVIDTAEAKIGNFKVEYLREF
jgi:hypothetical protein